MFSKSRRLGFASDIATWGSADAGGDWAERPLSLYGRNSASGTYGFFKEHAMKNGDFKKFPVKEQPGSAAVVQGVSVDRFGVGQGRTLRRGDAGERLQRQAPAGPLPLRLRQQGAGQADGPADPRVPQAGHEPRGPGSA